MTDTATRDELAAESRAARHLHAQMMRHPDPRDPEWPGHSDKESDPQDQLSEDVELARDWCDRAAHAARDDRKADAKAHLLEASELIHGALQLLKK